ncbi:unnamed protein product [Prorocentrum cordatum]|uniref:Protein kinase domain-containing protein n=1 Tax=Prorocentrum cordatum TaxID=2364126 RepID=A0ABN9PJD9_9DINO|nr:unnamed protein product [Polarella glacialis]
MAAEEAEEAGGERALQLLRAPDVAALGRLGVLSLSGADLASLPEAIGHCSQVWRLDIGRTAIQTLPDAIASLPRLKILFAANGQFSEIPAVLARCPALRMVGFGNNRLTALNGAHLPTELQWLIAAGNQIASLPNIHLLQHVRKLMLSHNLLTCEALAPAAAIADLEMLRVAANRLEAFPDALLRHPRLSWVAVGGNPFAEAATEKALATAPPAVDYSEVSLGDKLGSGAGANVYSATWRGREVAVKEWHGDKFSDGTARGEWAANKVAGHPGHPSIVGVLGTFEVPRPGMVLEKIEGATGAAGAPPFQPFMITRDLLPAHGGKGPSFTAGAALAIARTVASACAYLHSRGVYHGDVYLHNTLVVPDGPLESSGVRDVRLSDFGAATVVDEPGFFKIEARSFGWLLQDLLDILSSTGPAAADGGGRDADVESLLQRVRRRCAAETLDGLPTFAELASELAAEVVPVPSL